MPQYVRGYPKITGATDMMDSAMFAGMLALFDWRKVDSNFTVRLRDYVRIDHDVVRPSTVVRCPIAISDTDWAQNPKNVTRDNEMVLMAGLCRDNDLPTAQLIRFYRANDNWRCQNSEYDKPGSTKPWWNGRDWLNPGLRHHYRICALGKTYLWSRPTFWRKLWINASLYWSTKVTPDKEQNQILVQCMVLGPDYVRRWKDMHPDWTRSILTYWCDTDRRENDFAQHMIRKLIAI